MTESKTTPANWTRRALIVTGGVSGLAMIAASPKILAMGQTLPVRVVSVTDFGASGNGRTNSTPAFQRAIDVLGAGGGIVHVPAGLYLVDRVVVRQRGIAVELADGATIRKFGGAGIKSRGIFELNGLHDAAFELRGGAIDLNGEGPQGIGTPGRIHNLYSSHTDATVTGIAGPTNAAVYALRSTGIAVRNCSIRNSGENGLLFRNCADTVVEDCQFENIANWGIEYSFVGGDADGGSGPKPRMGNCAVSRCSFTDIDDLALNTGNGVGVGGGGGPGLGGFRNFAVAECTFLRCKGDIHFEFNTGSWIDGLKISRIRSNDARQGSLGLISVRNAVVDDYAIVDPGSAPFALLIPQRPEVFGIALSSGFRDITLRKVSVRDTRSGRHIGARDAAIARGSTRLRTSAPHFVASDVGQWIGVANANPSGTAYIGKVREVISANEIELDHPAGSTVSWAQFALGGVTRNGIILTAGDDVTFDGVTIEAGAAADSASFGEAAAIRLYRVGGRLEFINTSITAPAARGARKDVAVRVIESNASMTGLERARISGYAARSGNPR